MQCKAAVKPKAGLWIGTKHGWRAWRCGVCVDPAPFSLRRCGGRERKPTRVSHLFQSRGARCFALFSNAFKIYIFLHPKVLTALRALSWHHL